MNELQIFRHEEFGEVRTVEIDGHPWIVGKDVADTLGYANPSKALNDHVDSEDKLNNESLSSLGQRGGWLINESGLYSLVLSSKLPAAKKFKRWVTQEVLPSIRKHGMYARDEILDNPQLLMDVTQALIDERRKSKQLLEENTVLVSENTEMRPKARFADAVACAETDIPVGELAKILRGNGVDIGQNRLFEWMRVNEYLMQCKGAGWNAPTQKAMELGLFRVSETTTTRPDGRVDLNRVTMVTGKGQQYFTNMLLKDGDEALTRIVLDERTWAQDIIRTQDLGEMPMRALTCAARHYLESGLGTDAVRERLNALYNKGNACGFIDVADRILGEAGKRGLLYIASIPVTRRELQTIRGIDGIRRQRVAFALLALAKYKNHAHGENHDWVNFRHKDIFAMANVKVSVRDQYLLLNDLKAMGLLKYNKRVDNLDVRVLYADHEGPTVMEIHDMRNLGYQYMRYLGGKYVECKACGAVVPRKSPRQMYCAECSKLEDAKRSLAFYREKMGVAA